MNKIIVLFMSLIFCILCGCTDADIASENLSKAADNFEVNRRIIFYNGITGEYMMTIEGLCSKDNNSTDKKLSIVCKTGPNEYKKHLLGLSDNITYFIEQLEPEKVNVYHYRVIFKPSVIIPDIEIR